MMPDWSGGTRIGHAIKEFLDGYGRRGMAHGAVVLIVSDGWERDDPAVLPYLDDLVSGHSAAAMAAVVRALGADSG
jgi:uncharacterized protein with von Willebrand factor type A (vWA) domain